MIHLVFFVKRIKSVDNWAQERRANVVVAHDEFTFFWRPTAFLAWWVIVRESDIALFSVFNNGHHAADQVYFYESNSKKIVTLAVRARPKKI